MPKSNIEILWWRDNEGFTVRAWGCGWLFPFSKHPKLQRATEAQRRNWRVIGKGEGLWWPDVDEDLRLGDRCSFWVNSGG